MISRRILTAALALAPAGALAKSDDAHGAHAGQGGAAPAGAAPEGAATAGFRAANARMHQAMDIPYTGDPDIDFVRGMIPHHQGAIDMAQVALAHGRDPRALAWAREIIATQEREIAAMRDYLRTRGFGE
jgi:uncharacterized protein (DUF305 family)